VKAHTGEELHESDYAWEFGLMVMKKMKDIVSEFREETGLNFALARTPAESCAQRLAEIDLMKYDGKAIVNGPQGSAYYTNSFHVNTSADVPLWKRLTIEGAFHPLTDGGAMSHVFLGEANPSPEGIYELTKKIATKTAIQYFAFTKDLSVCRNCNFTTGGLVDKCPNCGGSEVDWWSRITGYYQNIGGWNKGKLQELKDRRRYGISGERRDLPKKTRKKINGSGVNGWDSELDF
jgi:anaerobic ribonucleoside-triphosphate reductase